MQKTTDEVFCFTGQIYAVPREFGIQDISFLLLYTNNQLNDKIKFRKPFQWLRGPWCRAIGGRFEGVRGSGGDICRRQKHRPS